MSYFITIYTFQSISFSLFLTNTRGQVSGLLFNYKSVHTCLKLWIFPKNSTTITFALNWSRFWFSLSYLYFIYRITFRITRRSRFHQPLQTSRSQPQQPPSHHTNNIDKDFDVLWSFLNINLKKKFHKTIDQLKCLITFLKDCICKKVVPKTFIIKHTTKSIL